jgi:hypothetical protein
MIEFINPSFLWAFSALSIPIIVHILNDKITKKQAVGSLLFFRDTKSSRSFSVSFQDLILFLLRFFLVLFFILFLLEPNLLLEERSKQTKILSSNPSSLQNLYPPNDIIEISSQSNFWQEIKIVAKEENPESLIVHSNLEIDRFSGEAYRAGFPIKFIDIVIHFPTYAYSRSDSLFLINAEANSFKNYSFFVGDSLNFRMNEQIFKASKSVDGVWLSSNTLKKKILEYKKLSLHIVGDKKSKSYPFLLKALTLLNIKIPTFSINDSNKSFDKIISVSSKDNVYSYTFADSVYNVNNVSGEGTELLIQGLRVYLLDKKIAAYKLETPLVNAKQVSMLNQTSKVQNLKTKQNPLTSFFLIFFLVLFIFERIYVFKRNA